MKIIRLETIDSTNSEAFRRLPELEHGTVLWALEQTAGRGQRGNSWFSAPGENLTFSVVLKFMEGELAAADAHFLNYAIAEAVAAFLESLAVPANVKWPNDVFVGRKKISGVLIENSLVGSSVAASVVGVGFNVNQKDFPQLANATSLCLCTGREYPLETCLDGILRRFEKALSYLVRPGLRAALFASYSSRLFQKGAAARYRDLLTGEEFTGVIKGADPADGRLRVLDSATGALRLFRFKELGYIL